MKKINSHNSFSHLHVLVMFVIAINLLVTSCFPEDDNYSPVPIDGSVGEIQQSIYEFQTFYSLDLNKETKHNGISDWDLGFESDINGETVILNSGDLLSIYNAGPLDFKLPIEIPTDAQWTYDASSGNKDSLAVKNWVNTNEKPYTYSNDVFIIRKNTEPFIKFKLINLNETHYTIVTSNLKEYIPDTVLVKKEEGINYVKISLQNKNTIIPIEPLTKAWDLQFTTYQTVIPDDDGVLTPYVVRGVLSNPTNSQVGFYYITEDDVPPYDQSLQAEEQAALEEYFIKITKEDIQDVPFSTTLDIVGYDWKDVDIDFETGTAIYVANTRNIYFIKSQNDTLYKLRFISYYNASGEKGYPTLHYLPLE